MSKVGFHVCLGVLDTSYEIGLGARALTGRGLDSLGRHRTLPKPSEERGKRLIQHRLYEIRALNLNDENGLSAGTHFLFTKRFRETIPRDKEAALAIPVPTSDLAFEMGVLRSPALA